MTLKPGNIAVLIMVSNYFANNLDDTMLWLTRKNPELGGFSPLYLMNTGRTSYLLDYIKSKREL